jgi:hypothetical protein
LPPPLSHEAREEIRYVLKGGGEHVGSYAGESVCVYATLAGKEPSGRFYLARNF